MKKWIFIILGVIALIVLLFKLFVTTGGGCDPPEKPTNVPAAAIWKGGCDGGNWIEFISIKNDTCRFKVYRDWNGDLILDADFVYKDCSEFRLTKSNWVDYVAYFGNDIELYNKPGINERCHLEPVYPAYYEESLESKEYIEEMEASEISGAFFVIALPAASFCQGKNQ